MIRYLIFVWWDILNLAILKPFFSFLLLNFDYTKNKSLFVFQPIIYRQENGVFIWKWGYSVDTSFCTSYNSSFHSPMTILLWGPKLIWDPILWNLDLKNYLWKNKTYFWKKKKKGTGNPKCAYAYMRIRTHT